MSGSADQNDLRAWYVFGFRTAIDVAARKEGLKLRDRRTRRASFQLLASPGQRGYHAVYTRLGVRRDGHSPLYALAGLLLQRALRRQQYRLPDPGTDSSQCLPAARKFVREIFGSSA